jgi:hypothetical protein
LWLLDRFRWNHLKQAWPNVLFLLAAVGCSYALLQGTFLEAASIYRQIGIGFMRTYHQSFYWYVPILLSLAFVMLLRRRVQIGERYFRSGLFLILLAVGNMLYFFGRSHEHNIINVSAALLFVLVMLLDLVFLEDGEPHQSPSWKLLATVLPILLVLAIAFFYSGRIKIKMGTQYRNIVKGQLIYPSPLDVGPNVLKPIVGDSPKVYFMTQCEDFYYDYYWNYVPQGHFLPYCSWVYEKDTANFVQGLLDDGYYVTYRDSDAKVEQETVDELKYGHSAQVTGWQVLWK